MSPSAHADPLPSLLLRSFAGIPRCKIFVDGFLYCMRRYVFAPSVKQAAMTGRNWWHFCPNWPFMVADVVGPLDSGNHTMEAKMALKDGMQLREPVASVSGDMCVFSDAWGDIHGDFFGVADEAIGALPGVDLVYMEQ